MADSQLAELIPKLYDGSVVPYLGAGALNGAKNVETGEPIPADSDSLILAMNNGKPMAPKLMYEFPRAAMNQELKRGRTFLQKFLTKLYGETSWTRSPMHEWLASWKPDYVVDINRDTQLQDSYSNTPHTLICGVARITASDYRFRIYRYDGSGYAEVNQEEVDESLPILFKPMGTPRPDPNFIASDADYVDYITELMGGFAIPDFLKKKRQGKQYLLAGIRLTRDSERMVLSDIIYAAADAKGWVLIPEPTPKEERFCARLGLEIINADIPDLLEAAEYKPG